MPKISVIVPIYNADKYLHRCIDSILTQTFNDFELLLVNDGSKDNSGEICEDYAHKDARVKVLHKANGGASSARNLGIDNACGEYISFIDSDDYVLPCFLETFMEYIGSSDLCILGIKPDYSIFSGYQLVKTSLDYKGCVKKALPLFYECQMFGSLSNKMFKKSIIQDNRLHLNETFVFREDEEFLLRYLLYAQTISATVKPCYIYLVPDFIKYKNADNFNTILSRYNSVVGIFSGKANELTDKYQIELMNEWLSILRKNFRKSVKLLPIMLGELGFRMFRLTPLKSVCGKISNFLGPKK